MNFLAAIRELEEKRDFYAAAIGALKKIAAAEGGGQVVRTATENRGRRRGTKNVPPATRQAIVTRYHQGTAPNRASVIAAEYGCSRSTVERIVAQARHAAQTQGPNGSTPAPERELTHA